LSTSEQIGKPTRVEIGQVWKYEWCGNALRMFVVTSEPFVTLWPNGMPAIVVVIYDFKQASVSFQQVHDLLSYSVWVCVP
jgi:hypothetical protein